jgi:RimJ/RimL family protein N-acetyltransferase
VLETIETERLQLRPFQENDAEAAFAWFGDPLVMRFVPGGPDLSLEATRRRVQRYREHQTAHAFSKWAIRLRGSVEPIGDSGLLVLDETESIDLGFRLARPYWGQGFATEAASAWVRMAFERLGIDRLTAFTHPSNVASVGVLRRIGFTETGSRVIMGMQALTFAQERSRQGSAGSAAGRRTTR